MPSARSAPTARSGTPTPTESSSSHFIPRATSGSSCLKRARPLVTLAAAAATNGKESYVRKDRGAKLPGPYFHGPNFAECLTCNLPRTPYIRSSENAINPKFAEFPFHALCEQGQEKGGPRR